ncbi:MAG: ABC transporter permease [Dehalococcoidales bacterium]|nr:ABC transporter permease [Dehalococcoidales bacterium]
MFAYIVRRLATTLPLVVVVSIIAFSLVYLLPGDAAMAVLGEQLATDEDLYQTLREEMGLDQPVPIQYLNWARKAVTGDFGMSPRLGLPVRQVIEERIVPTVELAIVALLLALMVALPVGVLSAAKPNSRLDVIGTLFALSGVAIPHFWLGIMMMFVLAVWLRWLPPSGYVSPFVDLGESLRLMIMPGLTLATGLTAVITRQVRSALIEVLQQEYIVTARAKGLSEQMVVLRHALKNALVPVVTVIGLQTGRLFGGAVVVEVIFSIPGMGRLVVDAIAYRELSIVQAVIMVMALAVLVANLLTDVIYAYLDPRIRTA